MRRRIQLSIGVLEATLACVLVAIGLMLPRSNSVESSFVRVEHVTRSAESQVRVMREQVAEVRQKDFPQISAQLRSQTRGFSARWKNPPIQFPTVESLNDSVLASALGLEEWSDMLDVTRRIREPRQIAHDSETQANSLARVALRSRATLEQCAAQMDEDCRVLHMNLGRPIDVVSLVETMFTLERMQGRLDRFEVAGSGDRFTNLREATAELENTLEKAQHHVELASAAEFPLLVPNGSSQPVVQMVPLWPQGKQAARNLRMTLNAVKNTNQQLDAFAKLARTIRSGSRADSGDDYVGLASLNEYVQRMRSLAATFQRTISGLQKASADWPNLAQTMRVSSQLLRDSHEHLDGIAGKQSEYERAVQQSRQVTKNAEQMVESYTDRIGARLSEQERSLAQMEKGLGDASEAIPAVSNTTVDLLNAIRWMFWLVGALIALHGAFVICETRIKPLAAQRNSPGCEQ